MPTYVERVVNTTTFQILLFLSGLAVVPLLVVGVIGALFRLAALATGDLHEPELLAIFVVPGSAGIVGMVGFLRAKRTVRAPEQSNIEATLVCLAIGVATTIVTASVVLALYVLSAPWRPDHAGSWFLLLLALSYAIWSVAGIGWMQRLARRYVERTGRAVDSVPVILAVVSIALTTAAIVATGLVSGS